MAIVSYTTEQLKEMKSLTDWDRVLNMKDEDIDFSDIPEITVEEMKNAIRPGLMTEEELKKLQKEKPQWDPVVKNELLRRDERKQKAAVKETIDFDPVTLSKLRSGGAGWQARLSEQITKWVNSGVL
ncbi:MAG: BrnA antitoxin family protein [Elusimicrobiota bacterium]|jgi:uncharacterized protein (DUF4415 family)|nr:BrnA antitoxin family protein [Elusimicrobiota bacterium]